MNPRLHQHRGAASVLGLLLAAMAAIGSRLLVSALPAQGQSAAPAALPTPTPTATPLIPPDPPTILTPVDGDMTTGINYAPLGMPTFSWALPPGATLSHIQISNTPGLLRPLGGRGYRSDQLYTLPPCGPTAATTGASRSLPVPPANACGATTLPSRPSTKTGATPARFAPRCSSRQTARTRSSFRPSDFTWTPVAGAAGYLFEIASDSNFATVVYKAETLKARHTPTVRLGSQFLLLACHSLCLHDQPGQPRLRRSERHVDLYHQLDCRRRSSLAPATRLSRPSCPASSGRQSKAPRTTNSRSAPTATSIPTTTYNTSNTDFTPPKQPEQRQGLLSGASRPTIKTATKPRGAPCVPSARSGTLPPSC